MTSVLLLIIGILYCLASLCGTGLTTLALWLGSAERNLTPNLAATITLVAAAVFLLLLSTGIIYIRSSFLLRRRPPKGRRRAFVAALTNTILFSLLLAAHITLAITKHHELLDFVVGTLLCAAAITANTFLLARLRTPRAA